MIARIPAGAARFRSIVVAVVAYACMKALLFVVAGYFGLISPSGSLNLGVAVLALLVLALRVWVLFAVPALLVYRIASGLAEASRRRSTAPKSSA